MKRHVYEPGGNYGRVTVDQVGPRQSTNPGDPRKFLIRPQRWYLVRCDCGGAPYWINHEQFRSHNECASCARKNKGRKKQTASKTKPLPVPDFARLRLTSTR